MNKLTVGSIFSGVGGFDLAAENAGMEVLWQSEVDRYASQVLEQHWPGMNLGDIHDVKIGDGDAARVDVLAGGFPCQSHSIAGRRGGLADDRGELWWQYHRLIEEGRPEWVVAENVPGLFSSNGGRDFTTIVKSLVQLGYGVVWRVLDAQHFGVPQRRRRVFIVGHSGGQPRPEVLAIGERLQRDFEAGGKAKQGVAAATETGVGGSDGIVPFRKLAFGEFTEDGTASTVTQRDYKSATDVVVFTQNQRNEVRTMDVVGALPAEAKGGKQQALVAFNYSQAIPTFDERLSPSTTLKNYPAVATGYHIQAELIGRGENAGPNGLGVREIDGHPGYTLNVVGGPQGVATGTQIRRLTPTECERLQGFPDNWTASQSDSQRYRQMGNAVAVPVAEWIFNRIIASTV